MIIQDLRDYAVILVDGKQVASLDRRYNQNSTTLDIHKVPATLEILVENTGRVNYGPDILFNRKGITSQVLWGNEKLTGWSITPLPLYKEEVSSLSFGQEIKGVPAFHRGTFIIEQQGDCFVDMSQWGHRFHPLTERTFFSSIQLSAAGEKAEFPQPPVVSDTHICGSGSSSFTVFE